MEDKEIARSLTVAALYLICAVMSGAIGQFWALGVTRKSGPFNLFNKLKKFGKPFTCSYCMCYWTSMLAFVYIAPLPSGELWSVFVYFGGLLAGPGFGVWLMAFNGELVPSD